MADDASPVRWYAFYSEKMDREYYYSPEVRVATWVMPDGYIKGGAYRNQDACLNTTQERTEWRAPVQVPPPKVVRKVSFANDTRGNVVTDEGGALRVRGLNFGTDGAAREEGALKSSRGILATMAVLSVIFLGVAYFCCEVFQSHHMTPPTVLAGEFPEVDTSRELFSSKSHLGGRTQYDLMRNKPLRNEGESKMNWRPYQPPPLYYGKNISTNQTPHQIVQEKDKKELSHLRSPKISLIRVVKGDDQEISDDSDIIGKETERGSSDEWTIAGGIQGSKHVMKPEEKNSEVKKEAATKSGFFRRLFSHEKHKSHKVSKGFTQTKDCEMEVLDVKGGTIPLTAKLIKNCPVQPQLNQKETTERESSLLMEEREDDLVDEISTAKLNGRIKCFIPFAYLVSHYCRHFSQVSLFDTEIFSLSMLQ